ncbi:hypothetical protein GC209_06345 [bacterium]|nr:hypothetical protein [bacterium]
MQRMSLTEIARRNRLIALKARTERRLAVLTAALAVAPAAPAPCPRSFGAPGHEFAQVPLQLLALDHTRRLHLAQFG